MPRINFAFCLHNHQPAGNLEFVFEKAYDQAYRPFLEVVERNPRMKVVLHYSGALLSWLEAHRPEVFRVISKLVAEGQAEMLTGGFYEPILPIIPERDRLGQIGALTHYLETHFNARPKGMWLTERVWSPDLVSPLRRAGVEFTVVDDNNFRRAGISEEKSLGHFTARGPDGETIEIVPINAFLRRAVPFQPPETLIDHLRWLASSGDAERLALFADDGEKFGEWPGTHQTVYDEGWLERFFRLLVENRSWLRVTTLSEFIEKVPPRGAVDLAPGSYPEMMEWSGGSWHNFLDRYPESNLLHRKMLRVSDEVAAMEGPAEEKEKARDLLYQGQSNDPYWHGVFGGLYLLHLRMHNYRSLLAAENIAHPQAGLEVEQADFDGDGQLEALVSSPRLNCYVHRLGGQVFELDHRAVTWNLLATLTRRRERYHDQAEDADCDWYPRRALIDHFLRDDTNFDTFAHCKYGEQGDFVNQPYEVEVEEREGGTDVILRRDGGAWAGPVFLPITLTKRLTFTADSPRFDVEYRLEHSGEKPLPLWFACESNFVFSSGDAPGRYYQLDSSQEKPALDTWADHREVSEIALTDEWVGGGVKLRFAEPTNIWTFPILTLSQGLEGWRRSYQGSCVTAHWRLNLRPREPWTVSFTVELIKLPRATRGPFSSP